MKGPEPNQTSGLQTSGLLTVAHPLISANSRRILLKI